MNSSIKNLSNSFFDGNLQKFSIYFPEEKNNLIFNQE